MKLSVISPVYMAEEIVDELVKRIIDELNKITSDFEIILVEDGSLDNSWKKIEEYCEKDSRVKGIKLSRNFGQHYAVTAGISKAKGQNIILMDCDLQDDPVFIADLLKQREMGYEIVFTKRLERKHNKLKSFAARAYNKLFHLFSDSQYDIDNGSMVLFSKKIGNVFLQLKDQDRLYIQMLRWMGFSNCTITIEHKQRHSGKSSYDFLKLLSIGFKGWTSHSTKLLKLSIHLGFFLSICSFLAALSVLVQYFLYNMQPGWPSIIITILFSTGLILLSIGITGIYIGKTYEQTKERPIFIIDKEVNINEL